jgi:hypothetical protein
MNDVTQEILQTLDWMISDMNFRRAQTELDEDPLSPEMQRALALRDGLRAGRIECRRIG